MSVQLGFDPDELRVVLSADSDFVTDLVNKDENGVDVNWPAGSIVTLRFGDPASAVWTATIVGAVASFVVDKVQVNTVLALSSGRAWLFYEDASGAEYCWAQGWVSKHA